MIVQQLRYACECDLCRRTVSTFVTAPNGHHHVAEERAIADGWRKLRFPIAAFLARHGLPASLGECILRAEFTRFEWLACPDCLTAYGEWLDEVTP